MNSTVPMVGAGVVLSTSSSKEKHRDSTEEEAAAHVQHTTPTSSLTRDGLFRHYGSKGHTRIGSYGVQSTTALEQLIRQRASRFQSDLTEEQHRERALWHRRIEDHRKQRRQRKVLQHRKSEQYMKKLLPRFKSGPIPTFTLWHRTTNQSRPDITPGQLPPKTFVPAYIADHNLNVLRINQLQGGTGHDCLDSNDRILLDQLLSEDLAETWPTPFGLWQLHFLLDVLDGGLTKSTVIRELKPRVQLMQVELKKILAFAKGPHGYDGATFREHFLQPCWALLRIDFRVATTVGACYIDLHTEAVIREIYTTSMTDPTEQVMLELVDKLLETKELAYATRFSLLLRRLEGRPFEADVCDSDLEGLWTRLFGEPYTPDRQMPADQVQ